MERLNNLPPFYIGQKVVCINPRMAIRQFLKKDAIYTVTSIKKYCCYWLITVGESDCGSRSICISCQKIHKSPNGERLCNSNRFAPIKEDKFPLISYSKVLEEVLIGGN